jgi:branched-chain amino acid transport system permease protein
MILFIQQVLNGIITGSTYAVVALGFALIFSVMRVVNLSQPDLFMAGTFVGLVVASHFTHNVFFVMLAAALVTGLIGIILERTVFRPLRYQNIMMPFIATAGIAISMQYGLELIFGPDQKPFPALIKQFPLSLGPFTMDSLQLFNVAVAFLIMVGISYYVNRTKMGLATRALAEKPDITATFGVNVGRVAQITVFIATAAAGLAGVSAGVQFQTASVFVADLYGLKSFICMIVAGNRSIEGVMLVGLLLGVTEALVSGFVSSRLQDAVAFFVLIVILNFKPSGLFGSYNYT